MKNLYIPSRLKKKRDLKIDKNFLSKFEEKIFNLYSDGKIKYPIHLSKGNEEILINIFQYIDRQDWVFCSWRNHFHALLHGITPKKLESKILSGRSMYISSKKNNFFSSSIAGGCIPIALGVAKSIQLKKQSKKVWLFIGDMTSEMGIFHEVYNYSKNHKLPLEIVIEDNGKSVITDTLKVWNLKKKKIPKDVIYYKYKLLYPHHGVGKRISF